MIEDEQEMDELTYYENNEEFDNDPFLEGILAT